MAFGGRRQWKTRIDGHRAAKGSHVCTACLHCQPLKFDGPCPKCKVPGMRVYFPSHAEHVRGAYLIRLSAEGTITNLRFHPRYDLVVEGQKITTYVADAEYRRDGKLVIEDTKAPNTDFMDPAAALKIGLFNALHVKHGVAVTIHRSS